MARAPHSERTRSTGARSIEQGQTLLDVHPGAYALGEQGSAPQPSLSAATPPSQDRCQVADSYHSPPWEGGEGGGARPGGPL